MKKRCENCKYFERTGLSPQGKFADGGICHAKRSEEYTQAGCDWCTLYADDKSDTEEQHSRE